MTKIHAYSS